MKFREQNFHAEHSLVDYVNTHPEIRVVSVVYAEHMIWQWKLFYYEELPARASKISSETDEQHS